VKPACAHCGQPFRKGQYTYKATVLTGLGAMLAHVCRRCRRLIERDDAVAEAFIESARQQIALMAAPTAGRA